MLIEEVLKKGTYRLTFKTPIELKQNTFDIQAEYKRVPSNFMTLGNASIQTDIQGYYYCTDFTCLKPTSDFEQLIKQIK